jgi:hypothetical protein
MRPARGEINEALLIGFRQLHPAFPSWQLEPQSNWVLAFAEHKPHMKFSTKNLQHLSIVNQ